MTKQTGSSPDWVSPPGETIEDLLEERGWTQVEFAHRTDFTTKHVNDLLKGRAAISADTAARLARVFGSTQDFWLVREAHYRAALERQRTLEALREESGWLKELPLTWMRARAWVKEFDDKGMQVEACMSFFGVANIDAWRQQYEAPLTAFRASPKFPKKPGSVAAWLRRGEIDATQLRCASYDAQGFKRVLGSVRALTNEPDPAVFQGQLVEHCAAHGVAVVFAPAPPGCPASGATRWLTSEKALLLLSLRHGTNDHLWFTFFHEAGHLLRHNKKELFIEGIDGLDAKLEEEANHFARDTLISPADARALEAMVKQTSGYLSKARVKEFANKVNVAPGIVVGRMQNEKWLPWSHYNDLKVRYKWDSGEDDPEG